MQDFLQILEQLSSPEIKISSISCDLFLGMGSEYNDVRNLVLNICVACICFAVERLNRRKDSRSYQLYATRLLRTI